MLSAIAIRSATTCTDSRAQMPMAPGRFDLVVAEQLADPGQACAELQRPGHMRVPQPWCVFVFDCRSAEIQR